jgi:hypothetical protein
MDWENIQAHLVKACCDDDVDRSPTEREYHLRATVSALLGRARDQERRIAVLEVPVDEGAVVRGANPPGVLHRGHMDPVRRARGDTGAGVVRAVVRGIRTPLAEEAELALEQAVRFRKLAHGTSSPESAAQWAYAASCMAECVESLVGARAAESRRRTGAR